MACNIAISSLLWWISGDGEGTASNLGGRLVTQADGRSHTHSR
jgi:hypothetical protein